MARLSIVALAAVLAGCGGGDKRVEEPDQVDPDPDPDPDPGDEMIPVEVLDSIQRTFDRKKMVIARCFVVGLDAGEVKKTEKGYVTVGATISPRGRAGNVRILEASLESPAIHGCVTDLVETWSFAEPPRSVETSFTYVLERF